MPPRAVRFGRDERGRPCGLEATEILWPLFDVDLNGSDTLVHKLYDALLRVDLGI